ncbi:AAA family ATPase [Paenibacillus donghaensis]|uniref:Adenylate kinase n=1 Tax=Paenibacillus donghaensis TaxID=414771 RepID=A0A2Z2KPV6_9BACL|nr:AAA family ATPase [Paenibacillus donghaensis]ASA20838.1 hypothetical protein B9T62_08625 [Paenibacillus donghaensis]
MYTRIHIMGASGAGTSTLGRDLCQVLPHAHLDTDDYFWEHKFTVQSDPQERLLRIKADLLAQEPYILSGAVCGWGDSLRPLFDLVIFLWVPPDVRLERLRAREYGRYGDEILPGGVRYEAEQAFLEWASLYDTAGLEVRSKALHEDWITRLNCPLLRLEENLTPAERVKAVMKYIEEVGRM